ncbi:DUF2169 family type VI secretion system accessory protein [Sorangium cellulosum]|uniref:DUF2169 domain-containing protein n=1 Tax=Sorangium cellulosum So0157-2 TaxID=1254432 RepID=S4XY32_SORCE|nr:DUF2169 domain-containing protein [Sorangium cellulosum]AGP36820.1 hypothetical protein SCE1572_21370 [Sorangium cellulosum So0157-2]
MQGAERLTVIVKATFSLVHERTAELAAPAALVGADIPRDGWGSLEQACETAPYLPSAGVLVRGHASAPAGTTVTALSVRFALFGDDRWILNKVLHVYGDRTREAPSPRPFARIPIVYERAYGGPHVEANPVGVGFGATLPNLVDPADATRPAGFGPIARTWAPRRSFLQQGQEPDAPVPALDGSFDFRYFQAAPADQQLDSLRGGAWIYLEGLHPHYPWFRSSLPPARGVARLYRRGPWGEDHEQPVELVADTLAVDADRLLCSMVWRGSAALAPGDTLARMRVAAGVEMPGVPLVWPSPRSGPSSPLALSDAPPAGSAPAAGRGLTLAGDEQEGETSDGHPSRPRSRPLAPFALAEPRSAPAPQGSALPGAPWSPERVMPLNPLLGETTDATVSASAPPLDTSPPQAGGAEPSPPAGLPFVPAPAPAPRPEPAPDSVPLARPFARAEAAFPPHLDAPAGVAALPPHLDAPAGARGTRATLLARLRSRGPLDDLELAGLDLDGIDFNGASLEHLNLAGATLARCNLSAARLTGANLRGADLTDARLDAADLTRADLSRATLDRAQLSSAILDRADLSFAKGSNATFAGASLQGADLRQARFIEATFDRANLAGINGSKADFSRAGFSRANLAGAVLRAAKLKEAQLPRASVEGADLRDADLAGANVYGVKLESAKSSGAILRSLVEIPPSEDDPGELSRS